MWIHSAAHCAIAVEYALHTQGPSSPSTGLAFSASMNAYKVSSMSFNELRGSNDCAEYVQHVSWLPMGRYGWAEFTWHTPLKFSPSGPWDEQSVGILWTRALMARAVRKLFRRSGRLSSSFTSLHLFACGIELLRGSSELLFTRRALFTR